MENFTGGLSYQQRVLLAAYELTREYNGKRSYEFKVAGKDLVLTPWQDIPGRGKTQLQFLRVTNDGIFGRDHDVASELEEKVKLLS